MSFPSLVNHLAKDGVTVEQANDAQLKDAFWAAFGEDLPKARQALENLAADALSSGSRAVHDEDPNSKLAQGLFRLVGTTMARQVCEEKLGVKLAMYNCCKVIAAPNTDALELSLREQAKFQRPESIDC